MPGIFVNLYVKERDINGTTWSAPQLLNYSVHPYLEGRVTSTITSDGNTHILYNSNQLIHRSYNCSTNSWSDEYEVTSYLSPTKSAGLSSASNDLYVVYKESPGGSPYIKYRHFDAVPLAPQNLTISTNSSDETVLNWSANTEPDLRITGGKYRIYRAETDLNGNLLPYQLVATINAINGNNPVSSWIDTEAGRSKTRKLYYKITAVDINQHESSYSNEVWRWGRIPKNSSGVFVNDFELNQNSPNPFNPTTKISWQTPVNHHQTLKVYDILGREVATLVDEYREAGSYEIEFDASGLPSGVYIYKLQSAGYSAVKKMILSK